MVLERIDPAGPSYELRARADGLIAFEGEHDVRSARWSGKVTASRSRSVFSGSVRRGTDRRRRQGESGQARFRVFVQPCDLRLEFSAPMSPESSGPAPVSDALDALGARVITRLAID